MVAPGGAWFLWGGMHGCSGGHAWFFLGGVHGCSGGCMWLLMGGGCAWLLQGGMHGCSRGGAWFFLRGGMHGFSWGGVHRIRRDMVNERAVRILLECILFILEFLYHIPTGSCPGQFCEHLVTFSTSNEPSCNISLAILMKRVILIGPHYQQILNGNLK